MKQRANQGGGAATVDRRTFVKTAAAFAATAMVGPSLVSRMAGRSDGAFLDDLSERSFRYFWEQADPFTGLVRDRATVSSRGGERRVEGSIAATGFGLAALCIGAERGWIPAEQARARVRQTLDFFALRAAHQRGWFYHFMDARTGGRSSYDASGTPLSEVSSIDTALLLGGVLTAKQYFHEDRAIAELAGAIYRRVDFRWMLNGHPTLLAMGWTPENGFIRARWDTYCELTILYILGIGSPTHALDPASWYAWNRDENTYDGRQFVGRAPLFTHQFSHAFIDYRNRREARGARASWFDNSVTATRVHRQFCMDLSDRFPGFSDRIWGVTASDSANGYVAWGGPPLQCGIDGTVVPCAAAGSLMFAPDICLPALRAMRDRFGGRIYGRYGFVDAFHPTSGWVNPDYIGIDVGITLLSAENLRSGGVWRRFMANPEIQEGLERAGVLPETAAVPA